MRHRLAEFVHSIQAVPAAGDDCGMLKDRVCGSALLRNHVRSHDIVQDRYTTPTTHAIFLIRASAGHSSIGGTAFSLKPILSIPLSPILYADHCSSPASKVTCN